MCAVFTMKYPLNGTYFIGNPMKCNDYGSYKCPDYQMSSLRLNAHQNSFRNINQQQQLSSNVQSFHNRLLIWRSISMAFALFAFVILCIKLHDVNIEINFLKFVSSEWLSETDSESKPNTKQSNDSMQSIDKFKREIDSLVGHLWSSRTALILSLAFVFVYIISWALLAYAIGGHTYQQKTNSLKAILLLAIFTSVDIAASAAFILVRLIMFALKNNTAYKEMRLPSSVTEGDQFTAIAALRYTTLKSSSGTTDILVSVIIAFLTSLRIYTVVCALSYFNENRKNAKSIPCDVSKSMNSINIIPDGKSSKKRTAVYPPHLNKRISQSKEYIESHSMTESSTFEDELEEESIKVEAAEMPVTMQRIAIGCVLQSCRLHKTEKHIAESVKQKFDEQFGPSWHCIVGRNWGSCVTHSKQCYIRLLFKKLTILIYKST